MDYVPGGDMMSLLIKKEVFDQPLACFYTAELTLALESVHKMGFIHRLVLCEQNLCSYYIHHELLVIS